MATPKDRLRGTSARAAAAREMNWRLCRLAGAAGALGEIAFALEAGGIDATRLRDAADTAREFLSMLRTPEGKAKRARIVERAVARARGEPDPDDKQPELPF